MQLDANSKETTAMKKITAIVMLSAVALASAAASPARAIVTTDWHEYGSNPVYNPGKAYYPTILLEGGSYKMWFDGNAGLQMATSADGISWTNAGTASGLTNPRHALVERIGDSYRMWYWNNTGSVLYSIDAIRTATSTDGLTWTGDKAITQVGSTVINNANSSNWNRGSYGPADVIYNAAGSETIVAPSSKANVWANKFVMYYDGTTGGVESLGLAVSNDGLNWQGYNGGAAAVLAGTGVIGDWDKDFASRGTIIRENADVYHMWYSGGNGAMDNGIGYASSSDGMNWTRAANPIFHKNDGIAWRSSRTYTPMVIGSQMWFSGLDGSSHYTLGYATPEPGSLVLLITASLGVLGYVWRRRRS
jgi:hypothetical protein